MNYPLTLEKIKNIDNNLNNLIDGSSELIVNKTDYYNITNNIDNLNWSPIYYSDPGKLISISSTYTGNYQITEYSYDLTSGLSVAFSSTISRNMRLVGVTTNCSFSAQTKQMFPNKNIIRYDFLIVLSDINQYLPSTSDEFYIDIGVRTNVMSASTVLINNANYSSINRLSLRINWKNGQSIPEISIYDSFISTTTTSANFNITSFTPADNRTYSYVNKYSVIIFGEGIGYIWGYWNKNSFVPIHYENDNGIQRGSSFNGGTKGFTNLKPYLYFKNLSASTVSIYYSLSSYQAQIQDTLDSMNCFKTFANDFRSLTITETTYTDKFYLTYTKSNIMFYPFLIIIRFYTDYALYIKISYISSIDLSGALYVNTDTIGSIKLHEGSTAGTETLFSLDYQFIDTGNKDIEIKNAYHYFGHIDTWQTQPGILIQLKTDNTVTSEIKYSIKYYGL